jgi:predicted NUDIX family phosphoesterase
VFLLKRTRAGGEKRLHDKLSIGVGGHINPVDLGETSAPHGRSRNPIPAATRRELEEELKIGPEVLVRTVGILNDDSNPVGAVHVGLVQILTVQGAVEVRETDQLQGRFADPAELRALLKGGANFESWSGLLIPHLDQLLSQAVALAAL